MSVVPLGHHVLVRPQKLEETDDAYAAGKRIAGFVIAGQEERKEQIAVSKGTVVSLGPIAYKDQVDSVAWCKVGDLVAYARHGGMYVEDPDTKDQLLLLHDIDIVALLKKE